MFEFNPIVQSEMARYMVFAFVALLLYWVWYSNEESECKKRFPRFSFKLCVGITALSLVVGMTVGMFKTEELRNRFTVNYSLVENQRVKIVSGSWCTVKYKAGQPKIINFLPPFKDGQYRDWFVDGGLVHIVRKGYKTSYVVSVSVMAEYVVRSGIELPREKIESGLRLMKVLNDPLPIVNNIGFFPLKQARSFALGKKTDIGFVLYLGNDIKERDEHEENGCFISNH